MKENYYSEKMVQDEKMTINSDAVLEGNIDNKSQWHVPDRIRVPYALDKQPLVGYDELERDYLSSKAAHFLVDEMEKDGLKPIKHRFRGKSNESMGNKIEVVPGFGRKKPIFDLVGVRMVFGTNDEVNEFIGWCKKKFEVPEKYGIGWEDVPWLKDFRKEEVKDLYTNPHMQPDYKAVHMRVPFIYKLHGKEFCDFLEIQAMTKEQYDTNKKNREAYEASKKAIKNGRVNLDEELNTRD